jgi:hypothetical protein
LLQTPKNFRFENQPSENASAFVKRFAEEDSNGKANTPPFGGALKFRAQALPAGRCAELP